MHHKSHKLSQITSNIAIAFKAWTPGSDIFRLSLENDISSFKKTGKIPNAHYISKVVSDYDAWNAACPDALLQLPSHYGLLSHVKGRKRLVKQKQPGPDDQCSGQSCSLLLSA